MQLVLPCAVADEGVVVAAELSGHVAQGKHGAEYELRVVRGGSMRRREYGARRSRGAAAGAGIRAGDGGGKP